MFKQLDGESWGLAAGWPPEMEKSRSPRHCGSKPMSNMRSAWRTRARIARVGLTDFPRPFPALGALGTSSKTRFLQFSSVNSPPCSIAGHWDLLQLDLQQSLRYGLLKFTKHEPQESSGFMSKTFGHLWTPLDTFGPLPFLWLSFFWMHRFYAPSQPPGSRSTDQEFLQSGNGGYPWLDTSGFSSNNHTMRLSFILLS